MDVEHWLCIERNRKVNMIFHKKSVIYGSVGLWFLGLWHLCKNWCLFSCAEREGNGMNLIQNYLTQPGCYKAREHITVKGFYDPLGGLPAVQGGCVHEELEQG